MTEVHSSGCVAALDQASTYPNPKADVTPFSSLSPQEKELIREKQRAAKAKKKQAKDSNVTASSMTDAPPSSQEQDELRKYPDFISSEAYFSACPAGFFYDPNITACGASLDLIMKLVDSDEVVGQDRSGRQLRLSQFQYFVFAGSTKEIWDPTFYARQGFEGFFTITTDRGPHGGNEPLPELQPFYGVIDWCNFNDAKHVKKTVRKLSQELQPLHKTTSTDAAGSQELPAHCPYYMYNNYDIDGTFDKLDAYQKKRHGSNWLNKKYFTTMKIASADQNINFKLHTIELYDGPAGCVNPISGKTAVMIAGEIGFSIGSVYTSLSGFYDVANAGTIQLVCLGRWLEHKKYVFWSMGHCYSPELEYKRQLGHRIYPRTDFLKKLRRHRGDFRVQAAGTEGSGFMPLADKEECNLKLVLGIES
eukprot:TRINITY_DN57350_c0_g1_i1.p1 TRINITY_DN57350_c0_g1~~TRINITY_DN57350_c0_g1_i1.p1  ORF type:complete len:420 (+),score=73.23 TRINITY_DN57350_c0_g1_i1:52-1311(+)